jgi:plasmid stabilization system protein ParE
MPAQYTVRITPAALKDLRSIFDYISTTKESPQNATKMIRTLLDAIDRLELFPHRYDYPQGQTNARSKREVDGGATIPREISH